MQRALTSAVVASSLATACSLRPLDDSSTSSWDRQVSPPSDDAAAAGRASCGFAAGALPAETQGRTHPNGTDIPIDHIVVVMQENRSADSYFQQLPSFGQPDFDVAPAGFTNPDLNSKPVAPFHETRACVASTTHSWAATHRQINGGAMDGFVLTNEGHSDLEQPAELLGGERAMGYYDATDLPFYYWLASEFSIADRYFCALPGPTWPNRMYLYAASSFGRTHNAAFVPDKTLFDDLDRRHVDWKVY